MKSSSDLGIDSDSVIKLYYDKYDISQVETVNIKYNFFSKNSIKDEEISKSNIKINRILYNYNTLENYIINSESEIYSPKMKLIKLMDEWGISLYNKLNYLHYYKDNKDIQCSICYNKDFKENLCLLNCNHVFCYKCICTQYIIDNRCPLCRKEYELSNLVPLKETSYSKLEKLKENINNELDNYEKILIYIKSTLIPHLDKYLEENKIAKYILNKKKLNKLPEINSVNKIVILLDSKNCSLVKHVKGIKKIIIMDREYEYILKKENIGYDFINKLNGITIDIYEPNK
jgi:hypothetical protein